MHMKDCQIVDRCLDFDSPLILLETFDARPVLESENGLHYLEIQPATRTVDQPLKDFPHLFAAMKLQVPAVLQLVT